MRYEGKPAVFDAYISHNDEVCDLGTSAKGKDQKSCLKSQIFISVDQLYTVTQILGHRFLENWWRFSKSGGDTLPLIFSAKRRKCFVIKEILAKKKHLF